MKKYNIIIYLFALSYLSVQVQMFSRTIDVGQHIKCVSIRMAIEQANDYDTILVRSGSYKENNIIIEKKITLIGLERPILDGERKYEIVTIKADSVTISGFRIQSSGYSSMQDYGGIKVINSKNVIIINNQFIDTFFGIYLQRCSNCIIKDNSFVSSGTIEQEIGNGIHCWKSDSLQIIHNTISGHRDGIYFEFVTNSIIWRNISENNLRYGLHFMFSNNDSYITNSFKNNGAGVAVMYTKKVVMLNNYFSENWGDAAYGILLKDITDSYLQGNRFVKNTTGIFMEGANRISIEKNTFLKNGWALRIQADCMENNLHDNNFISNTFDVATNGKTVMNKFYNNYWDKYEGYDLDKNLIGDVPYRPLSLFCIISQNNASAMLLYKSFIINLLDKSERFLPTLTPENFIDPSPRIKPFHS